MSNEFKDTRFSSLITHHFLPSSLITHYSLLPPPMRIKLILTATQPNSFLPINSNHAIASLIYHTIGSSSHEFAKFLHEEGFAGDNRNFKMFTFSRPRPEHAQLVRDQYRLIKPTVELQISSPITEFVEHFVTGLFQAETFQLTGTQFTLQSAETLPMPEITQQMQFRCLSPITESVRDEQGRIRYLDINEDWSEIIGRNLLRKYQILHGQAPEDQRFKFEWDQAYLSDIAARGKRASALLDIRGVKIRGWLAPFTVEGSKELIELGYETGFGSRNSMGFGMAEKVMSNE